MNPRVSRPVCGLMLSVVLLQSCAVLTREAPPPTPSLGLDGGPSCAGDVSPTVDLGLGALSILYAGGAVILGLTALGSREDFRPGAPSNDASGAILLSSAGAAVLLGAAFTASSVWGFQHPCADPKP